MGVWQSVKQQVGGLAKHVVKTVVQEPVEILENAVGASGKTDENENHPFDGAQDNRAMEAVEQGVQGQQQAAAQGDNNNQPKGFKTAQDYQKYQQLSGHKDEMELAILRKRLFQEQGLDVSVEGGMQKARMEYAEKEKQRNQVAEQKKQEEKWVVEQKKKEDLAVKAATETANPEKQAWGAG